MFELIVCNTSGEVLRRFDLARVEAARARVVIGRAEDCDLRIRSSAVSRHHCVIERDELDRWIVRDLGSTHGVVVDGTLVPQAALRDGLKVRIGPAVLSFGAPAASVAQQVARELGDRIG